ncbi:uncharacterized protein LTHEOB_4928 [Neofusicoccum parvum]|nr:uncharacterized protein LTHEOB_4928 [Neofusicoccum parvum]
MTALFKRPDLPENALNPRDLRFSHILIHPDPAGVRKDGTIMRTWLAGALPNEFRKNNNCMKVSSGVIAGIGRQTLNISNEYWQWLKDTESPPLCEALGRRDVLCDEEHNKHDHSQDSRFYACPFEHNLADPQWTHGYEHIVCRNCEACQPDFCSPIVKQMLTEGPLVAMCEHCAVRALAEYGAGYNGCECTRGAFGGMCLSHQDSECSYIARRWLEYRTLHHGDGGSYDAATGQAVVVPFCRCGRAPVARARRPFAFWCAACEQPVVLPANGAAWPPDITPQRWLRVANLPTVDYDAPYARQFLSSNRHHLASPSLLPSHSASAPTSPPPPSGLSMELPARTPPGGTPPTTTPPGQPAMTSMGAPPPGTYTNAPRPRHTGVVPGGSRRVAQWSSAGVDASETQPAARKKQPRPKIYSDSEDDEEEDGEGEW